MRVLFPRCPGLKVPPSFIACFSVIHQGEENPWMLRSRTFTPWYAFLLTIFLGADVVQGFRHGRTPASSCVRIFSVTISYTDTRAPPLEGSLHPIRSTMRKSTLPSTLGKAGCQAV